MPISSCHQNRKKLVESERTPTILALLWQHDLNLKRETTMLDKTHRSMHYRMTVGQKMAYKQFQKHMHQHDVAYARLMGDKQLEQQLRRQNSGGFRSNTNFSEDYDDDGLLKRIWYAGNTARDEYKRTKHREFFPEQMRPATATLHSTEMYLNTDHKTRSKRAQSSVSTYSKSTKTSRSAPAKKSKLLKNRPATSFELNRSDHIEFVDDTASLDSGEDGSDEDTAAKLGGKTIYIETGGRPKTAGNMSTGTKTPSRPQTRQSTFQDYTNRNPTDGGTESAASKHIYQGPEHSRRPKLVDLYKDYVQTQSYGDRMKQCLDNMQEFREDKDRILKDYYTIRLVNDSEKQRGEAFAAPRRESVVDPVEYRQCAGDPYVRTHTFKRLRPEATPITLPNVAGLSLGSSSTTAQGMRAGMTGTEIPCE